jgi:hypothetical protein
MSGRMGFGSGEEFGVEASSVKVDIEGVGVVGSKMGIGVRVFSIIPGKRFCVWNSMTKLPSFDLVKGNMNGVVVQGGNVEIGLTDFSFLSDEKGTL